jgi:D-sedoheptulose 7-phosphate isomerase
VQGLGKEEGAQGGCFQTKNKHIGAHFLCQNPYQIRLTDPAFGGSVSPYRYPVFDGSVSPYRYPAFGGSVSPYRYPVFGGSVPSYHSMSSYSEKHLAETVEIAQRIDSAALEKMADLLLAVRERGGRLFFLGVGGSAANASHAVNDFRKIAGLECYAPTDNVSELTARTNDEGWASVFVEWLRGSRLNAKDAVMVFSVGGGSLEKNVSPNLVSALQHAKEVKASVLGIVGRDGGYTATVADAVCIVPTVNPQNVTPHSEAFQAVIWHLLVSHPKLKIQPTKWESTR